MISTQIDSLQEEEEEISSLWGLQSIKNKPNKNWSSKKQKTRDLAK